MTKSRTITRRDALACSTLAAGAVALAGATPAGAEELGSVLSADVVDYLYIDSASLGFGEEQHVVAALRDRSGFSAATLSLLNVDTGAQRDVALSKTVDNTLLFSLNVDGEGTYYVQTLSLTDASGSLVVDFSDADASVRSFEVSAASAAPVLLSADGADEDVAFEVYGSDSEGELVSAASIEDAAAVAVSSVDAEPQARGVGVVVALDPGHVGASSGASGNGLREEEITWKIAQYCRSELDTYEGVSSFFTVTPSESIGTGRTELKTRVSRAKSGGADVLVSLHINSTGNGSAYGAEVYYPYNGSYNNSTHAVGKALADKIIVQLEALGLYNRGTKIRVINGDDDYAYADGSDGDYYGIIRYARQENLPAIIVEHAFIDNRSDAANFLNSPEKLRRLGVADAAGIANYFGLSKAGASDGTMYRLYNPNSGEHFYTASSGERDNLIAVGWNYEGVGWTAPTSSNTPVYRLYNPNAGDHHYTTSDYERDSLVKAGWRYEGIGWYSADAEGGVPLYRQYNPNARTGTHNYTTSAYERDSLIKAGWRDEGIGWYALS